MIKAQKINKKKVKPKKNSFIKPVYLVNFLNIAKTHSQITRQFVQKKKKQSQKILHFKRVHLINLLKIYLRKFG